MLTGEEAVRADLGEVAGDGPLIDPPGEAGLELTECPDGQQWAQLRPHLDQVHERHLIIARKVA
jgi:hypothetical protein